MIILSILLGGLARALVGAGRLSRWAIYPPVAVFAAFVGLGWPHSLLEVGLIVWVVLIASCNLAFGRTDWENRKYMALRFGLPSLVLVSPLVYTQVVPVLSAILYLTFSVLAGLFYPHRQRVFELLRLGDLQVSWLDSSRLVEFVAGACILGGLSLLRF